MRRQLHRSSALAGAAVVVLCGCKPAARYQDDIAMREDLGGFGCFGPELAVHGAGGNPAVAAKQDACGMLHRFQSAQPFTAWPRSGVEVWYGPAHCTNAPEGNEDVSWASVALQAGPGVSSLPGDVKTDPSRVLPVGAVVTWGNTHSRGGSEALQRMLQAVIAGKPPDFINCCLDARKDFELPWENLRRPAGPYRRLYRSDGTSALDGIFTTKDEGPSALRYLRGEGDRLLVLETARPPSAMAVPHTCIAELEKGAP